MTPEQIDAVLPRVPAGIPALTGDLTDDEERAVAVRWLLELYREAELVKPVHLHSRDPHDIRHGDTWEARENRATIVASNDWPPPAKGTHESDLAATIDDYGPTIRGLRGTAPDHYFDAAMDWSRSR